MPKPAKEPKPPRSRKEPKPVRPPKEPRERKPREPRDPTTKPRQRFKKGSLGPSESNFPSPSLAGEENGDGCAGSSVPENGYSLDGGENHRVNGDRAGNSRPSTGSNDSLDKVI